MKRFNASTQFTGLLLAVTLVIGIGCSEDSATPPIPLIDQAWALYEAGDYAGAAGLFNTVIQGDPSIADAHNGLGWSEAKRSNLDDGLAAFDEALTRGHSGVAPHAGRALVLRDIEPVDWTEMINAANTALGLNSTWSFSHDSKMNWTDLRVMLAQAYFATGDYTAANAEITALPDGVPQDPNLLSFVENLLAEIERLTILYTG